MSSARIGRYPVSADGPLIERLAAAMTRVRDRLSRLDTAGLGLSDYSRAYLEGTLVNGVSKLNLYAYLLYLGLRAPGQEIERSHVVDFGGGNGLLAVMARELGVARVTYTDIDEGSAADARRIAAALGLEADAYLVGETAVLRAHLASTEPAAVLSYDVIEHVYDVESYLGEVGALATGPLAIVMGSAANGANPRIARSLARHHRLVEHEDRAPEWGHKERDSPRAYRALRREIIHQAAPSLDAGTIELLADRTRGLADGDIRAAVGEFMADGRVPPAPDHPTNTCDPATGNWAEHLLEPRELAAALGGHGFRARVLPGFYNPYLGSKGLIAAVLNEAIARLGRQGLRLAPYYIVAAER